MVDHLSCTCKILTSISRTTKKIKKIEGSDSFNPQNIACLLSNKSSISVEKSRFLNKIDFCQRSVNILMNMCFYCKYEMVYIKIEKKMALYTFHLSYNYIVES